jgi:methyltransferase (TIGR00027 family)
MQPGQPSRTALGAAGHRAAHQVLEGGRIFSDPLALRILGPDAEAAVRAAEQDPGRRRLRLFIALRARVAEDALALAFQEGVRQLVVLGAGLDTFACRNPLGPELRMFEVDHPATQAWKRDRLAQAGIAAPANLAFVPVDFQREALGDCLARAGFAAAEPSFFSWLGVVPYLTEDAVWATLKTLAAFPGGARAVLDYGNPPAEGDAFRGDHEALARRAAAAGEAILCQFETADLHAGLAAAGFRVVEDLGPAAMRRRLQPGAEGSDRGGHILVISSR